MLSIKEINLLQAQNEGLKKQNVELQRENARLKEEIKEVKKYQYEQEFLEKEIEEIQKALKTLAEGLNKRQILLQEIKAIAERGFNNSQCNCGLRADIDQIIQKITKAEEE